MDQPSKVTPKNIQPSSAATQARDWLVTYHDSRTPVEQELVCDLPVTEGKVPITLAGNLYRNGPGKFSAGKDDYSHPFDGDGMVSRFEIGEGRVRYTNAYVKTAEFIREQAAGRMLYRGFGSNLPGGFFKNALKMSFKNAANTNVLWHGGRLLALWEGGWPHQLDANTLETLSRFSFDGGLKNQASFLDRLVNPELPFSAHPKIDPASGRLYNFGLAFGLQNRLMLYTVDPDGKMSHVRFTKLPELSFVHDFVITSQSKAVFFCSPVHFDMLATLSGISTPAMGMKGDPSALVKILVIDLEGPPGEIADSSLDTFEAPYAFIFHHINAFEEGGKIHIFSVEMDSFPSAELTRQALRGSKVIYPLTRLVRYTLKAGEKQATRQLLPIQGIELPRVSDSFTGLPFSYFFANGVSSMSQFPFLDQIQKISTDGSIIETYQYDDGFVGEPVVAPTRDGNCILSVCYNHRRKLSELIILHEARLELAARVELPHSQPVGFHGNWVPTQTIQSLNSAN
jgi:all-trans-8'-apo-beta-carotenal 15,15'-oxygenase